MNKEQTVKEYVNKYIINDYDKTLHEQKHIVKDITTFIAKIFLMLFLIVFGYVFMMLAIVLTLLRGLLWDYKFLFTFYDDYWEIARYTIWDIIKYMPVFPVRVFDDLFKN